MVTQLTYAIKLLHTISYKIWFQGYYFRGISRISFRNMRIYSKYFTKLYILSLEKRACRKTLPIMVLMGHYDKVKRLYLSILNWWSACDESFRVFFRNSWTNWMQNTDSNTYNTHRTQQNINFFSSILLFFFRLTVSFRARSSDTICVKGTNFSFVDG